MKKFLSLFTIGLLVFLVSCSDEKTESAKNDTMSSDKKDNSIAAKNIAAYEVVENAFETGDVSKIDSVVSSDFVDHTDRGDMGRDSLKAMIVWMQKEFAGMKTDKMKTLADDEYVMGMRHYSGTSNGSAGMPPKGEPYSMKSIEVVKFKDGKAVEHWAFIEMADAMKMMAPPKTEDKMKGK